MRHILVVDDALDLGRLLKTALSLIDSTMPIVVVPSGEEALLEGTRYPLDLLITDIRLPGISGVELIQKIRKHHPGVRIIVITGMSDEQIRREVKALNVDYFFTKPLSMPDFTEAARRCLEIGAEVGIPQANTVSPEAGEASKEMADVISSLRSRLDAMAVAIVNERARIEAEAGTFPDGLRTEALADLMAVIDTSRGLKGSLKADRPEIALTVRTEVFDLVVSPVEKFVLVVILKTGATNLRFALCLEETLAAQKDLAQIFKHMGLAVPAVPPAYEPPIKAGEAGYDAVEAEAAGEDLQEFEAIFDIQAGDADDFWEKAADQSGNVDAIDPEVLTYDQARQLGLAPDADTSIETDRTPDDDPERKD